MGDRDVEVDLDGLAVLVECAAGDQSALSITVDRKDGRDLVDRLCKALGYWPTRRGPVVDVHITQPAPPPVIIPVPVEPRHRWRA